MYITKPLFISSWVGLFLRTNCVKVPTTFSALPAKIFGFFIKIVNTYKLSDFSFAFCSLHKEVTTYQDISNKFMLFRIMFEVTNNHNSIFTVG